MYFQIEVSWYEPEWNGMERGAQAIPTIGTSPTTGLLSA